MGGDCRRRSNWNYHREDYMETEKPKTCRWKIGGRQMGDCWRQVMTLQECESPIGVRFIRGLCKEHAEELEVIQKRIIDDRRKRQC